MSQLLKDHESTTKITKMHATNIRNRIDTIISVLSRTTGSFIFAQSEGTSQDIKIN